TDADKKENPDEHRLRHRGEPNERKRPPRLRSRRRSSQQQFHEVAGRRRPAHPEQWAADPLPMWVADTDFAAPKAVTDALHTAVDHGVFGYPAGPTPSYLEAVAGWQRNRFGWE